MFAFIRHGQTDWNRDDRLQGSTDIPLNDAGRAQAHEAAELLRSGDWEAVVSSPLVRARETAQIIADQLRIELGPAYPELVERDYGSLEGESSSEWVARHPD
ncbi:MAG TPA: histidine phosphatase family protein, partial [Pseudolysinimonas sp.]